jgi:hypothetical protein
VASYSAEALGYIEGASILSRSEAVYPFNAYKNFESEYSGLSAVGESFALLLDPSNTKPALAPVFNRDADSHSEKAGRDLAWYMNRGAYQFADHWLDTYYQSALANLPTLPRQ